MPAVISLRHPSGTTARVLSLGFNCFSFCPVVAGAPCETLWCEPGFEIGERRPSGSGIPVLFPYAGRLGGKSFTYGGRTYEQASDDGRGNAIHGFVHAREWRIVDQSETHVTGEFSSTRDDPSLASRWPADFCLRATCTLGADSLEQRFEVTNPGDEPLPFALGTHGYFRVPLVAGGAAEDCTIRVPAAEYWELVNMLPTGRRLPVDAARDLRSDRRFGDIRLDDVLTNLDVRASRIEASLEDRAARRRLEFDFDPLFRHCVVYNPPHREAICIEPYTTGPDPFRLAAQGVPTNQQLLSPGESWSANTTMRLRVLS